MLVESAVLLLSIIGVAMWLSAIIGFGMIAAPILHRSLPPKEAGELVSQILDRAHLVGWYGALMSLTSIIIYSLRVSTGAAEPAFLLWSLPLILASSIWWVSWKKILPKANNLRIAINNTDESEVGFTEAKKVFDEIHKLSVALWKGCLFLILSSIAGLAWLSA
jgi:hypothetical protein